MTTRRLSSWLSLTVCLIVAVSVPAATPQTVSPGDDGRLALVEQRCPTFSWGAVAGALAYELAVYALPENGSADLGTPVLAQRVVGTASSWTPSGPCLPPGSYAWFLRAVLTEENAEVVEATEWSEGRYFAIAAAVAPIEERVGREPAGDAVSTQPFEMKGEGGAVLKTLSVPTAPAAIKGASPDTVGEVYGVVGTSASPSGAGVAAANTSATGGADLVLDGSAQGQADARLSQSGIDRPAATDQTFTIGNSGAGSVTLAVDGAITGSGAGITNLNASNLASGTVPSGRLSGSYSQALTLSNTGNSFSGNGAGLTNVDAATLGGTTATAFATEAELAATPGPAVNWGNLSNVPPGFADGVDDTSAYTAGPGLILTGSELAVGAGNGIAVAADSVALGALAADWSQTGAFDLVLANAGSELKIMETAGGTFYGVLDVGDLTADQTYTLTTGGTVWTAGNDGASSTLDADLLDGQQASAFANSLHTHSGADITSGTVAEPRIDAAIARDTEIMPAVLAGDGASSTLDADLLDGQQASAFAAAGHTHSGTFWLQGGNSFGVVGTLGTLDAYALDVVVNSVRALRIEPNAASPNLIGGYSGNLVTSGAYGAAIGGGGAVTNLNRATDNFATIAGGRNNQAGDNAGTTSDTPYATVGGGQNNIASATGATVCGGSGNMASLNYSVVGGGGANAASGWYSTVAGGVSNTASGNYATVAGGSNNAAAGLYSFAGGRQAKANGDGCFVWADSIGTDFACNTVNQFAVRANGGVNFQTGTAAVQVNGNTTWHAGNDGAASTLDADLLDGQHASAFVTGSHTHSGEDITSGTVGESFVDAAVARDSEIMPTVLASDGSGSTLDTDLLDGQHGSSFAGSGHNHDTSYFMQGGNSFGAVGTLGTNDNFALELEVNTNRVLRLEPGIFNVPNLIGGYSGNSVTAGAAGATIAGGGSSANENRVTDHWGTVGGGFDNTAGDNAGAVDDQMYAAVGGGLHNKASGHSSTIGGGSSNLASSIGATIGGGSSNLASGESATVSGGYSNEASGIWATVPGGYDNTAAGDQSFAAGYRASANFTGCFVWADSSSYDLVPCDTYNQWVARVSGGVYFYTSSDLSTGVYVAAGGGSWASVSDRNLKANLEAVDGRAVLEAVAALPIATWSYISQDASIRHIGPMAQDFAAAFRVGEDDTHITTVDADGVALAAIQGLAQTVKELQQRNAELEARLAALEARLGGTPQ